MYKETIINPIQAIQLGGQTYNSSDTSLISSIDNQTYFDTSVDFVEYFIYDKNKEVIVSNYNYRNYTVTDEGISLDPIRDLEQNAYTVGSYYTVYNFVKTLLNSSATDNYYISEISTDRTEIRLSSTTIDPSLIIDGVTDLQVEIANTSYYKDFYLNLGNNQLFIANNIAIDSSDTQNPTILLKLYDPLPEDVLIKTQCWVVDKIADSVAYSLTLQKIIENLDDKVYLRSPNYNIPSAKTVNNSTEYQTLNTIYTSTSSSLTAQLKSLLEQKGAQLNIDYTDYNNFVYFSSAETRLENFAYKLQLIEEYTANSTLGTAALISPSISASKEVWEAKIQDIIYNFDDYEYFLYYSSGSHSWPKSNSTKPYQNISTTSSITTTWLTSQLQTASLHDQENSNALRNSIPSYLVEDTSNANYVLFMDMVGQHFDTLYTYTNALTEKYNSDNRADYGLSKDLIADALRDLGVKLYESNLTDLNLYNTYLGFSPSGDPSVYTGSELIDNIVIPTIETSPGVFNSSSLESLNSLTVETYKRLYHNLPYLLKKKGTVEGLSALINCFGIPDTILGVNELGNSSVDGHNYWRDFYSYAIESTGSGYILAPWLNLTTTNATPKSVQFRFKTAGLPTQPNQTLVTVNTGSSYLASQQFAVVLEYTGSGTTSGSYEGSIPDPYRYYGTLKLLDVVNNTSTSVYLPVYNGDWWSVMLTEQPDGVNYIHTLYVKNKINSGADGNTIGFQASGSTFGTAGWIAQGYSGSNTGGLRLGNSTNISLFGKTYSPISASFQELRYYTTALSESVFNDYVMNPTSIEGNSANTLYNTLLFRAPLGTDLSIDTTSSIHQSRHPSNTLIPSTASFIGPLGVPVNAYVFSGDLNYRSNVEAIFYNEPTVGLRTFNNSKIQQKEVTLPIQTRNIPVSSTLSPYIRVQQGNYLNTPVGLELNTAEVAFSPQNEINKDIINQLGYFNIGEYIGDPRTIREPSYKDLKTLKEYYFSKYQSRYNYKDYIRLVKYFNNLLFNIIKDFTPTRSSISTGVIIKQTLLERDKYVTPLPSYEDVQYTGSVQPFPYINNTGSIQEIDADSGGIYNGHTSSFTQSYNTPQGIVNLLQNTNREFYNGELNNTVIVATTQSLLYNPLLSSSFASGIDAYNSVLYGDYVANINNVNLSRTSNKYLDVDYNAGGLTPLNFNNLISGSGTDAEVQDSNYNLSGSYARSRYVGKQQTVSGINQGKEIIVGQQRSYMAYYDWASSTLAERSGSANFHVMYLIDENGNLTQPTSDTASSPYLPNLIQNFSETSRVNIITYKPQLQGVGNELKSTTTVIKPAKTYNTVLYSDTGSNGLPYLGTGYKTSITLSVPVGVYDKPYGLSANGAATVGSSVFGFTASFDTVTLDEANGWNTGSSVYTVQVTVPVRATLDINLSIDDVSNSNNLIQVYLYKNNTQVSSDSTTVSPLGTWTPELTYEDYMVEGDKYYVVIRNQGTIAYTGDFTITPILSNVNVNTPYFTTGSNYTNVLTSSAALGALYGYYQQTPVISNGTGSGFSDPSLLTIQQYDEIRFEGKEFKTYQIISSSFNPTTQLFYLFLNHPLYTTGTNIQYFAIRRYVEDPGFLLLNSPDTVSPTGPGFIVPEFMSDKLKANYGNIVKDFAQKNLI